MGPNLSQVERVADSELVYVVKDGEGEFDCGPRKESHMTSEERFERIENNLATVAVDLAQIVANGRKTDARLDRAIRLGIQEVRVERRKRRKALSEIDEKITQLAAAQLVTEEKLQVLIDALKRGGNGSGEKQAE